MVIVPIFQKAANEFVRDFHEHHKPVVGSIFQIGLKINDELVGVAICGRPVSPPKNPKFDYRFNIEVNRLCVKRETGNGKKVENGCSKLYGSCARIAKEMGYLSIITYTLESEPGTSLIASGWVNEGKAGGKAWNSSGDRIRTNKIVNIFGEVELKSPEEEKIRWRKILSPRFALTGTELIVNL